MKRSSFAIAAPQSGSGKTTLSLGLMRAISRRGLTVRPFKCGPDYIDTQFHRVACGRESINLDTFMSSQKHVREIYARYSVGCDVSIVEGAMGMLDGYNKMQGSCGETAVMLGLPVMLVIDASSTAYSVAATIYGFKHFRKDVNVIGVIFNKVASVSHFAYLRDACIDAGVECLGYMPRRDTLHTPSRHLGLSLAAIAEMECFIDAAADIVEATVDIDRLLSMTSHAEEVMPLSDSAGSQIKMPRLNIAVARDEAFNFLYPVNIDALRSHPRYDINISYFSPLVDDCIPEDTDIAYLPGGYPELYAQALSANAPMRESVRRYVDTDGRLLAECGGLIYMCRDIDGTEMCGVLPLSVTMYNARLTLGYRTVEFDGFSMRGHEFHYSRIVDANCCPSIARQSNAKGRSVATHVYRHKNCIAGYTHLYWGESDILRLWNL